MAQTNNSYPVVLGPVVGQQFCCPHVISLAISDRNFVVTAMDLKVTFAVKSKLFSPHGKCLLIDGFGNPVLTLYEKIITAQDTWKVFRGDSTKSKDLLFNVKRSSLNQFKTMLNVFLAASIKEDVCDFKVKGSWSDRSCTVFAGESSTVLAHMYKLHPTGISSVTVYPNVDYAFIVSLIVILERIDGRGRRGRNGGDHADSGGGDNGGGDERGNDGDYVSGNDGGNNCDGGMVFDYNPIIF